MNVNKPRPIPSLVLHVSPGGLENGGGIGRMIGYMIDAWRDSPPQPEMRVLDSRGPGHILFSPWHFAKSLLTIARLTPRRPLLHIHVAGRGSTVRKIMLVQFAHLLRLPIVLHLHDYNYRESLQHFPRLIQRAARSMFRIADIVVVLGPDDHDLVENEIGVASNRIAVIPNAVPKPHQKRRASSLRQGPVRILFLGNPSRRKGVHNLIAALTMKPLRSLDWHITVAGGGRDVAAFREQASAAGLSDRVTFTGWVDRTKTTALLESADVITLPSYAEGMAMSVLEGMSHGLCVVCTPVGSLKDVVEDGVTGLLVQPGDVGQLSKALSRAVSDQTLRAQLGDAAVRVFSSKFDVANYPDRMRPIYYVAFTAATGIRQKEPMKNCRPL